MAGEEAGSRLCYEVTFLEMAAQPAGPPERAPAGFRVRFAGNAGVAEFQALYDGVGAGYHWTDLHQWPAAELRSYVLHPETEIHLIEGADGTAAGFFQLDFRRQASEGVAELAFFGLLPDSCGRGIGRWALDRAVRTAWRDGVERVDVNTCTLDHPAALALYERAGFRPVRHEKRSRTAGTAGWQQ